MKVLAIASIGGHWIQLLRLRPAFQDMDVVFVSTNKSFASLVVPYPFYAIKDFSRKNKLDIIKGFFEILKIIRKERPSTIITTGAAPGLIAIIVGRLLFCKTIWIDSLANVEELSMSGKIAIKFANKVYTQWAHLESEKVTYAGSVIS